MYSNNITIINNISTFEHFHRCVL